ncbi:MAG: response regulator transcription factor [Pedobacter sp.]|nr:response regulator transcription factor [Pedobacter sp.]
MRILIVEDDSSIAALLVDYLHARGHEVDWAASAPRALALLDESEFEALILDRGLPRMEGLRFLRLLREEMQLHMPVLVLTARDSESDKLEGFDAGADDYVVKPFSLAEVEARLLALLRRSGNRGENKMLRCGKLCFDTSRYELTLDGQVLSAGPKTLQLLEILMRESGRVFTHEQLEMALWKESQGNSDKLRQVLYQARKLVDTPGSRCSITTVHGRGYRLDITP